MRICSRFGLAALVAAAPAWAAEPTPSIGPVPAWVVPVQVPAPDPAKSDAPVQFLLSSSQQRITASGVESHLEMAAIAQTTAGLQALGTVALPWNAERTDLTLHRIAIQRGTSTVDLLKPNEFLVLRRENNLERAVLDGIRTVVIPANGLQTGDVLLVSVTYKSRKSSIGNIPEEVHPLTPPLAMGRTERRFLIADDVAVRWKIDSDTLKPQVSRRDGFAEHLFVQSKLEPPTLPKNTPARLKSPLLQLSAYPDWSTVADELDEVFDKARRPAEGSQVIAEAAKISASTSDPAKRMLAALRLAQERVRYVALLLGDGAYVPATADETWERKFGDCKGKTALLLALLDQLGVAAEPVLVSSGYDDRLAQQLPSMAMFDHVLVRATIGGRAYFLDPTDYGQRTVEELAAAPFRHGLALKKGATLETFAEPVLSAPSREAVLTWDASSGTDGPVPYEATLTYRGAAAASLRAKLSAATDMKAFDEDLKSAMAGVANEDLEIKEKNPEGPDGTFTVRFAGKAEMDWAPFEGERNRRYAFSHSTFHWDADFDRKEGPGKEWPVYVTSGPYWERLTETVILPEGAKGYSIDGEPVEKMLAGSRLSRTLRKEANRITMVSDFQHLKREISAEEARAAEPQLEDLNDNWAYIVGPRVAKQKRR